MKKFIITLFALVLLSIPAYAFEAAVPQFDVYANGMKLEHKNTEYPLLVYKDITYFPMTYDYVRMLGMTSSWVDGKFYLSFCPGSYDWPTPEWAPEAKTIEGEIAAYPIYVNGKLIDNSKEEYPIFNARGITYFPLTWRFATEEFGMELAWDGYLAIECGGGDFGHSISRIEDGRIYFGATIYNATLAKDYIGSFSYEWAGERNYIFDTNARTVVPDDGETEWDEDGVNIYEKLKVEGNYLTYDGTAIADVSGFVTGEAQREKPLGINVYGTEYELGGGKSIFFARLNYLYEFAVPHPHGINLWFIKDGESFTPVEMDQTGFFVKAEYINGVNWLCLFDQVSDGWEDYGPYRYSLYTIAKDNSLVRITDSDHDNIVLLGQIGGKPVVKATWQSEYGRVSAVNDGYFTVEADGSLNRIYPYVFCDDAAVVNDRLYLLIWRNNTIVDVLSGEEISF